ncbi:hypothetical protein AVDCRST_MAG94-2149, partial [uncultured Leptolyngbya sp.]
ESTTESKFKYTLLMDCTSQHFSIVPFLASIVNTMFESMKDEIETQQGLMLWTTKDGHPLRAKALTARLQRLLHLIELQAMKNATRATVTRVATVSRQTSSRSMSPGSISQRTTSAPQASRANRRRSEGVQAATPRRQRRAKGPESSLHRKKQAQIPAEPEISIASALTEIPTELRPGEQADYTSTTDIFEKYWSDCQDCYLFDISVKKELEVSQLFPAPEDWTIRAFEQKGMEVIMKFLMEMPDKTDKQTLCVMPAVVDDEVTAENWDELKKGKFWIINGQHSVAASKAMIAANPPIGEQTLKYFRTWNCYIVYTRDKEKLRKISAFYNRVNHFNNFLPSWATNIIGARPLWVNLGRPKAPPAQNTPGGRALSANERQYNVSLPNHSRFSSTRADYAFCCNDIY